ncbi:MAG: SRPBCC family protein [Spirochaetia bacterium]|nr:SRPBCC family protein [Spirochaetia bacterium]
MQQQTTVINEIDISVSPEKVFDLVSSPGLWPKWHPSSRHLAPGADRPLKKGEGFSEEVHAGGRKGNLVWIVSECDRPRIWIATATSDQGVSIRLQYEVLKNSGGTRFKRTLTYEMTSAVLIFANTIFMRYKIKRESAIALRNLKALLEGGF